MREFVSVSDHLVILMKIPPNDCGSIWHRAAVMLDGQQLVSRHQGCDDWDETHAKFKLQVFDRTLFDEYWSEYETGENGAFDDLGCIKDESIQKYAFRTIRFVMCNQFLNIQTMM